MKWPQDYIDKEAICTMSNILGLTKGKFYRIYDIANDGDDTVGSLELHINNDADCKLWYPLHVFAPANCNCNCPQCMSAINTPEFKVEGQSFGKLDEGFEENCQPNTPQLKEWKGAIGVELNRMAEEIKDKEDLAREHKYPTNPDCRCSKTGPGYCKCAREGLSFPHAPEPKILDYIGAMSGVEMKPALSTSHRRVDGISNTRAPHACPVCFGRGQVPSGFYASVGQYAYMSLNALPETCKSCSGSGVVWG